MGTLTRTGTGLLLQEAFTSLTGWTDDGPWSSVADPVLLPFGKLPTTVKPPAPGPPADISGVREGQLYVEGSEWWLLYDAGPRNDYPHCKWFPRLAVSKDRGGTWEHVGVAVGDDNGSGGTVYLAATGWLEKRSSTYYLHRVLVNASVQVAWDIWTASSLRGPWTFNSVVPDGSGGTWNALEHLPCCVVKDGATYYAYSQGDSTLGVYKIGYLTGSAPDGPWTAQPVMLDTNEFGDSRMPENAKVFYHSTLGVWVLIANCINPAGTATDRNVVLTSATPTGFGSSNVNYMQRNCTTDGDANIVGVVTHATGPDGALIEDSGYVPILYDSGSNGSYFGWFPGRRIFGSVLEPSSHCARITGDSSGTAQKLTKALSNSDFTAEFAVRITTGSGTSVGFWYRMAAGTGTADAYRMTLRPTLDPILEKVASGTASTLATGSGENLLNDGKTWQRVRITVVGSSHKLWVDGELVIDHTDASYASGSHIAFAGVDVTADVRLLSIRSGSTVTVSSLSPGKSVTLRTWGELLVNTVVADASGVATFTVDHSPYRTFEVDGADYDASTGVWGGDAFTLTGTATVNPALHFGPAAL